MRRWEALTTGILVFWANTLTSAYRIMIQLSKVLSLVVDRLNEMREFYTPHSAVSIGRIVDFLVKRAKDLQNEPMDRLQR